MMHPGYIPARNGMRRGERETRRGRVSATFGAILLLAALTLIWCPLSEGQTGSAKARTSGTPLSRGIAFYEAGRYEDAMNELRIVVDSGVSRGRALAFYYAGRIRMQMGNLPAARKNLLAARADSTGFHDAVGLLAWTNLKMGNRTDALIEWRQFVKAVGPPDSGPVTVESIIPPEEYRRKLARAASARAATPAPVSAHVVPPAPAAVPEAAPAPGAASAAANTIASASADSAKIAPRSAIGKPDSAEVSLTNIDQRIESRIRRGYYGIGAATLLLLAGLAGTVWWMGRRRRPAPPLTFSATVNRALDEVDAEEGLLPDGENLEREFERRRTEMVREIPYPGFQGPEREDRPKPVSRDPETDMRRYGGALRPEDDTRIPVSSARGESIFPDFESDDRDTLFRPPAPARSGPGAESGRNPITEEVKALVTRMYREGRSVVEIARIADLTRTEVELILAVRAHSVEQLIETASREEEDTPDQSALSRAIGELHAEGRPPRETARRLGISVTEVNLALAMMEKKRKERG